MRVSLEFIIDVLFSAVLAGYQSVQITLLCHGFCVVVRGSLKWSKPILSKKYFGNIPGIHCGLEVGDYRMILFPEIHDGQLLKWKQKENSKVSSENDDYCFPLE